VALRGARPTDSITQIRVDSEVSLAGGRELWGIPKELASLGFSAGPGFTARTDEDWIATAAFARRAGPALGAPAGFDIAQTLAGASAAAPSTPRRGRTWPRRTGR
jgi:hypothetical protein